ncbi:MAG: hypothetical protein ACUVWP_08365 [bacterium]
MRKPQRIIIIIISSTLCIFFLLLYPFISIKILFRDEQVYRVIDSYSKSTLGKNTVIERAHLDLFPSPSIVIDNLKTDEQNTKSFSSDEILVKLNITDLLLFRLKIREILLKGAQITTTYNETGDISIIGINRKGEALQIPDKLKVKLENSRFELDGIINGDMIIEGLSGDLELRKKHERYTLESNLLWTSLSYLSSNDEESPIIPFKGSLNIMCEYNKQGSNIKITRSSLIIGESVIDINGRIERKDTEWAVSLSQIIDSGFIEDIINILSPKRFEIFKRIKTTGRIDTLLNCDFILERSGGISNFHIDGSLSLSGGNISTSSVSGQRGSISNLSFRLEINDRGIIGRDIKSSSNEGGFAGNCEITFGKEPTYILNIDGKIDLGLVSAFMNAPKEWQCEGKADARVLIEGELYSDVLPSTEGRLDNIKGSFSLPPINERIVVASGTLLLKRREVELINAEGMLNNERIYASGKLKGFIEPTIDFRIDMESLDLDRLARKGLIETQSKGDYKFTMKGSMNITKFKAKGFTCENLSMNILFSKNTIRISNMNMTSYSGTMSGSVEISVPDGTYNVNLSGKGVDIGTYLKNTTEYKTVISGGVSDFYINFNGKGTTKGEVKRTIIGSGRITSRAVSVSNLTVLDGFSDWSGLGFLRTVNIKRLHGEWAMEDGKVKVKRCEIEGTGIDNARLFGTVAFNGDLEMICQLRLTKEYTEKYKGSSIALFPDSDGRSNIAFICYGTTKKPKFHLDYEQMRKLAEGSIPPLTDEVLEKYKIY